MKDDSKLKKEDSKGYRINYITSRIMVLLLIITCLFFSGCECDEDTAYEQIKPNPKPSLDKVLIIQGPLPDMAKGGGVAFAPSRAMRAAEFNDRFSLAVVDREDPALAREIAPVALNGDQFSVTIPISDSRISPLIVVRETESGNNLLSAMPGRVPAYNEVPESVRQIIVRGMPLNPQSTSRSLLAIANNVNPDFLMVDIAQEEETQENIVRELQPNTPTDFDTIIENNVGGPNVVNEFSRAVQTVTTIIASPAIDDSVRDTLALGSRPDAASVLNAYVTALNSDDSGVINAFNEANLPRSIQLSETLIDARSSTASVTGVVQNTIQEAVDHTPPVLEYVSISPSLAGDRDRIVLNIRSNEPLIRKPSVKILDRQPSVHQLSESSFTVQLEILGLTRIYSDKTRVSFVIDEIYDKYGNRGARVTYTTDDSKTLIDGNAFVAAPEISVPGGFYSSTFSVILNAGATNAIIKYTTDGSTPDAQNGLVYDGAISINGSAQLKAVVISGRNISGVSSAIYYIVSVPSSRAVTPVFHPVGSTYFSTQSVTLISPTEGAVIKYTLDGSRPDGDHGITYSGPFTVSTSLKALAIAYKDGMAISDLAVAMYTIEPAVSEKVAAPSISLPAGLYSTTQSVSLTSATAGAVIRYTLDGSEPSISNGAVYTAPLILLKSSFLKAVATKTGMLDSDIARALYTMELPLEKAARPVITPASGTFETEITVGIASATPGASVYYTIDVSNPSIVNGTRYTGPFKISKTTVLKAVAVKSDMSDSDVAMAHYINVKTVDAPEFSLEGGQYTATQSVALSSKTEDAVIYYTLNGTVPSAASGILYGGTLEVSSSVTIKAIAVKTGMINSTVSSAAYLITIPEPLPVAALEFNPAAGTYTSTQSVEIICPTGGASIYYTLDGGSPSRESSRYEKPVTVFENTNIKAIAIKAGMKDSPAAEAVYVIKLPVAAPIFKPAGGSIYTSTQSVEITSATAGVVIYYTLDGSAPSRESLKYEAPVIISKTTMIKAFAVKDGMTDSPVGEANYPVLWPVSAPIVSIGPGAYENTVEVAISCATPGAVIYYTTDGCVPTSQTAILYTAPVEITCPLTIKAIAVKEEMSQSTLLEAAYMVPTEMVAAPVITPNGGFFYYQTNVTINSATEGAEIYYTIDGSEPSKLSTKYEAPFALNRIGASTVKAAAFKSGMFHSMTAVSAAFNIAYPPPQKPATPVIGEDAGKLTLSCATSGAKIYYTLDGSAPTAASSLYDADAKITIAYDTPGLGDALKAAAIANGVQSDIASITIAKDNDSLNAAIEDTSNAPFVVAGGTSYNGSDHTIDKTFIFKETLSGVKPDKIVTISAREGTSVGRIDAFDIAFHNATASIKAPKLYAPQGPSYGSGGASGYAISTINIVSGDFSDYVNADESDNKLVINRPNFTLTGASATGGNKTLFKRWFQIYDQSNITLKNFAIALDNANRLVVDITNLDGGTIEGLHLSNSSGDTSSETMRISGCSGLAIKNNTIDAGTKSRPAVHFTESDTITFTGNTVKGSIKVEHKFSGAELSSIVSLFSSNSANTFSDPYLTISGATNKYLFSIVDSGSININGGNFEYGSAQVTNLIGSSNTFNNLNQDGAKFDMLAWPDNNYNYGYYYGDTVPERLFIKTGLAKKAGDDGFINATFAAKGAVPAGAPKIQTRFLESTKPFTDAWTDKPDAAVDNTQALAELTGIEAAGGKTYFVRLKSSGDTGSPAYNGYSEIISITLPVNSITLTAGSHGTAGNTKVTGLTAGKKYVIKADGANWKKVIANGTAADSSVPDSTDAGLLKAAQESIALDGVTEITGLTNGTTYTVYEVLSNFPVPTYTPAGAPSYGGPAPTPECVYTIKTSTAGAGLDLTSTSEGASNISLIEASGLVKIAAGASGVAKISVGDANAVGFGETGTLIKALIGATKFTTGDTLKFTKPSGMAAFKSAVKNTTGDITLSIPDGEGTLNSNLSFDGHNSGRITINGALPVGYTLFCTSGLFTINTAAYACGVNCGTDADMIVSAAGGNISTGGNTSFSLKLEPDAVDSIKGNIDVSGNNSVPGLNVYVNKNITLQNGKALTVQVGQTLVIGTNVTLSAAATDVDNYASLTLQGSATINGADTTAKVHFDQFAKYTQGDTTVRFCDAASNFTTTVQETVLAWGIEAGTANKLRAGDYIWSAVSSKFIRYLEVCFAAGTLVVMADGSLKPIEAIAAGDKVKSYDFISGRELDSAVSKTINRSVSGYFKLNGLKVTGEHPFAFGNGEWKKVKELKTGDRVKGRGADKFVLIYANDEVKEPIEVYNISVDGVRNYFVFDGKSFYLVHNK